MMKQKRLHISIWSGILIGGCLISLTLFGTFSIEGSLFWGLLAILVGIPLMGLGVIWLSFLIFSQNIETRVILREFKYIFISGSIIFLIGLFLLSGVYLHHAFLGQMEGKWILFWPMILAACIVFWVGIYRKIASKNFETIQRWERFLRREDAEPRTFLKYLLEEIILQKQLREESLIRWLRHILIYWGFVMVWLVDLSLAFVNDFLPVFGWSQFLQHENVVRLVIDFLLDIFGLMVLAGTSIALIRAYLVRGTDEKVYNDTLTAAFLFVVVLSGYLLEGLRLASIPYEPYMGYSFVGSFIASLIRGRDLPLSSVHHALWLFHVILSCAFIAYFPVKRLVHSCAIPVGKLMQSQKVMLEKKVMGVVSGMLQTEE